MNSSTPQSPKPASPLKILLIGPPGSHKTSLAMEFPGVHFFDCDRLLDGPERFLRTIRPDLSYTYDNIRRDDKGEEQQVDKCYQRLLDKISLVRTSPEHKGTKVTVTDSLSQVNEFIIRHVLKGKGRVDGDMEARDWGPFKSAAYNLLVGRLEETGKTVICTAHEIKLTSPGKNISEVTIIGYEPFFQGKVGDTLGAFFSDVWRMEVVQGMGQSYKTILQTVRTPKCEHLKNSLNMPAEIDVSKGFSAIELYLKGRI